ncbi:hypothetical protein [Hyphomicrobium sp.]|uniref:hypothetical protein n=1 Tax=Hyphomicrobium sp. TaxID=82 RepID=UPI000FABA68E|nr:hypothetical protein [Hyphomicrobium sp.]RUP08772.1 MAG: hypothetical protein EKK38_13615 [Hyphomicrobium sp.]
MSKHLTLAVMISIATVAAPAASEAHWLGLGTVRTGIDSAFVRTTALADAAFYKTQRLGNRMFGWLNCGVFHGSRT